MPNRYWLMALSLCFLLVSPALAEPLCEKFLLEGKLADGAKALQQRLKEAPDDDQARAGLGVVQFLQTFEHFGASLYKYGLRTERIFRGMPGEIRELLPQNPKPEKISYQQWCEIMQAAVDDLTAAEKTLAEIKDDNVKLPLHVAQVKIDFFGIGKPISARSLMRRFPVDADEDTLKDMMVGIDRGDLHWLRGYCHFLCAFGEIWLSADGSEHFHSTAHIFFEKVDSPYEFFQEEPRTVGLGDFDARVLFDVVAYVHLLRLPVKEPARTKAALGHLEAMLPQAKAMWKHYMAETDDDNEWIPNPKQTGVLRVPVTDEMVGQWQATLDDLELVLQGKRLVPFWRGEQNGKRGVNIRKAFIEPRTIDPVMWIQGTAAAPYLEEGDITNLADPRTMNRLSDTFGGLNFFGFAFWFN